MSTYALAEQSGVSQRSIGRIEQGKPVPLAHLEAVCRVLRLVVPAGGVDAPGELLALQRFGRLLSERRNTAGLSRLELAQKARVSEATIRHIELARHPPSRALCIRLVRIAALGLTWADVEPLGLEPPPDGVPAPAPCAAEEASAQSAPSSSPPPGAAAPHPAGISERLLHAAKTAQRMAEESPATLRKLSAVVLHLAARAGGSLRHAWTSDSAAPLPSDPITLPIGVTLEQAERELIRCTLAARQHSRQRTAETLGISRRSLYHKLREHKIPLS